MKLNEFNNLERIVDKDYKDIILYRLEDGEFYLEPNFLTQLEYLKDQFLDDFPLIINTLLDVVKTNKKVIFTADFESPVVYKDNFIYREIDDILGKCKLSFDNKANPDSDWKD
ncbi:MAG TPA: hypothetical protein VJY64_02600 [Candidatus Onthovivens sp.]|nr:hypothetical protein [Candidatus Onthovivens sp.]